jgi:hypothetical protein
MVARFSDFTPFTRIGLVTCAAAGDADFAPKGQHLRWFVSRRYGFPAAGFDLWRIDDDPWKIIRRQLTEAADLRRATGWTSDINWSGRERHYPVHPDVTIVSRVDAPLTPTAGGLRVTQAAPAENLLIHFKQPVIFVRLRLRFGGTGGPTGAGSAARRVSVRHGAVVINEVALGDTVEIEHPAITDLLVPKVVEAITSLDFVTELAVAEHAERHLPRLTHLDLPTDGASAYDLTEVAQGIDNRLFSGNTIGQMKQRYRPAQVSRLVSELHSTLEHPDRRLLTPGGPDLSPAHVRVLDFLLLAAVDPNVARMLACYWVDRDSQPGLYLVRGEYGTPDKKIGLGLAFSRHAAKHPELPEAPKAKQLPGIEFTNRQPQGRAGLMWRTHPSTLSKPSTTTMIDVSRRSNGIRRSLTKERPHLVPSASEVRFTDRGVPVPETYVYEVTPIDIFGRRGPARETEPLKMLDLERPVPPKNVVASLAQVGAPWSDPSRRDPNLDRTGSVKASAEFGEAQHTVAPDAIKLRWCWRRGHRGAANRNPSVWHELHGTSIVTPHSVTIEWPDNARLTRYPVAVGEVRVLDDEALRKRLDRLDPITTDAIEQVAAPDPLVEILLDVAVLEPDLFTGHRIVMGDEEVAISGSTAGVAFADDETIDGRLTARLFVPLTETTRALAAGAMLAVDYPRGADWQPEDGADIGGVPVAVPPPLIEVPLPPDSPAADRAYGGEVAIDLRYTLDPTSTGDSTLRPVDHDDAAGRHQATIVGRVVADHRPNGARSVLIRVRPGDADRLLQIERLGRGVKLLARHHRPYVMPAAKLGLDGESGAIQLDLAPDQRFETIWISAVTVDAGGKESAHVATPAELRVIRPPPAAQPSPPFPERAGAGAARGELSPPNVKGDSTTAVAWAAIDADPMAAHVRYELARALDTTIIAADRERWLRGAALDGAQALGVIAGPSVTLTVANAAEILNNGTVRVVTEPPQSFSDLDRVRKIVRGRVRTASGTHALYHRLVRTAVLGSGQIEVLFRPFVEATETAFSSATPGTDCIVEGEPDYAAVLADSNKLRQLADLPGTGGRPDDSNERAFGLVTGVPFAALRFVDRLPGRGRSRFFYKMRAVYPGETRSAWSPCSVAFHQLDATPAEPPVGLSIIDAPTGRIATFGLPKDPVIAGVRLTSRSADGQVVEQRDLFLDAADPAERLRQARFTSRRGLVDLRQVVGAGAFEAGGSPQILGLFPADIDRADPPASANLLPVDADGERVIMRSVAVPRTFDGRPLALQIVEDDSVRWLDSLVGRFEIELGPANGRQALAALKYVTIDGTTIPFHSEEISVSRGEEG